MATMQPVLNRLASNNKLSGSRWTKGATRKRSNTMWPVIRHIGLIDTMISVCHIGYVSIVIHKSGGIWRNSGEEISRGMHQSEPLLLYVSEQFVFFLMEHLLLVLRCISACILFGTSMKADFRRHFNACILWVFTALLTVIVLKFQLLICQLELVKVITSVLDIVSRIVFGFFVINYMRNEKQ